MRVLLPIVMALAVSAASHPAVAQSGGGATITKDNFCGGFVPTASGGTGPAIYSNNGVTLVKGNGSSSLTCHFDVPAALIPKTSTRARGFSCFTYLGFTTDTRMQASSGGSATLTCRIRARG